MVLTLLLTLPTRASPAKAVALTLLLTLLLTLPRC